MNIIADHYPLLVLDMQVGPEGLNINFDHVSVPILAHLTG